MSLLGRLRTARAEGRTIQVAIVGAGLMGRGLVRHVNLTPGMRTALLVCRTPLRGVEAFVRAGLPAHAVTVTDDEDELARTIEAGRSAVTTRPEVLESLVQISVVVEATGSVAYGAAVALHAIRGRKHVVTLSAELDITVGVRLQQLAQAAGVVYTGSDGDQPGVLNRLVEYVEGIGLEVVAAVNCKGFLDAEATPDSIRPWALKQHTSLPMTTAFTDGTKMNVENAVLANATGLVPEVRGMHGVRTDQAHALADCLRAFRGRGLVDYTLGGDFGGGVFVIGFGEGPDMVQPYMKYLKMGDGPHYVFFRPYHLCHMETPLTIAEAVLDHEATIAPRPRPVSDVITIAKRDLAAGERLDGIGGYTCYGRIDRIEHTGDLLPIGLTNGVRLTRAVRKGDAVPWSAVELDEDSTLLRLRR